MPFIRHSLLQVRLLAGLTTKEHANAVNILRRAKFTTPSISTTSKRSQSTIPQDPVIVQQATASSPPPRRSIFLRILRSLLIATGSLTLGVVIGWQTLPARDTLRSLLAPPPTDAETLSSYTPPDPTSSLINSNVLNHPLAQALRTTSPNLREQRPHLKIPAALRATNLTGGTLAGPGRIVVPPLTFIHPQGRELYSLFYLGANVCGHPGIVHGGLLATLLDEGLARCCFPAMPNGIAVTASLKVDYRRPVRADEYYVLKAETTRVEGRKAWVRGWIEVLRSDTEAGLQTTGEKLVEAEALFIEPRNASMIKKVYNVD